MTPAEIRALAKELDFAIDVTEPREVILQRFIDILSPVLATTLLAQSEQHWAGRPAVPSPADPQPEHAAGCHLSIDAECDCYLSPHAPEHVQRAAGHPPTEAQKDDPTYQEALHRPVKGLKP